MSLRLQAHVGLDGSGFEAGLNRLEHAGKHAFGELRNFALASFGVAGIEAMFMKSVSNAKELTNAAKQLGSDGVEGVQLLRQAAKDASIDLVTVEKAFEKLNVARSKVLNKGKGWEEMAAGFKGLGINDLTMSTQAMVTGPMRNAALTMNPANFEPLMKAVTGLRSVSELIPFLQTDFEELGDKMKKMGMVVSTDMAVKLKAVGDNFEMLSQILVAQVGPALLQFVEWLLNHGIKPLVGIEATGAALGGGTANWSFRDFLKYFGFGPAIFDYTPIKPFDKQAAKESAVDVMNGYYEFQKSIAEAKKKLEEEANRLKNPTPPNFDDFSGTVKDKPGAKGRIDSSDSLVRVGNFLGDSQGSMVNIAEKQLVELRGIRQILGRRTPGDSGYRGDVNDDATFPTA